MADPERDCATTRRNLKALRNKMKRKAAKLGKTMAEDKPTELDLAVLSRDMTQLQTMQDEYEESSSKLTETETDEDLLEQDTAEFEIFDEEVNEAMKTCNRLQSWYILQHATVGLDSSTTSLNEMLMKHAEDDFSGVRARLEQEIELVKTCLRGSRLETGHPLYTQAMDTVSRANMLRECPTPLPPRQQQRRPPQALRELLCKCPPSMGS